MAAVQKLKLGMQEILQACRPHAALATNYDMYEKEPHVISIKHDNFHRFTFM